jgi:hypothetical protein
MLYTSKSGFVRQNDASGETSSYKMMKEKF